VAPWIASAFAEQFAMTTLDVTPHSRGAIASEFCKNHVLEEREGAGNAGCFAAPAASCATKKAHELVTAGEAETSTFPARWC